MCGGSTVTNIHKPKKNQVLELNDAVRVDIGVIERSDDVAGHLTQSLAYRVSVLLQTHCTTFKLRGPESTPGEYNGRRTMRRSEHG